MSAKIKAAKEVVKALGLALQVKEGPEYRVYNPALPRDRREATAYYTNDLEDAVNSGVLMAKQNRW
jgi:hypothetical protein